jgi:hypothetical protein
LEAAGVDEKKFQSAARLALRTAWDRVKDEIKEGFLNAPPAAVHATEDAGGVEEETMSHVRLVKCIVKAMHSDIYA